MKKKLIDKPFGEWASPITARMLAGQLRLGDVQWDSQGKGLIWFETYSGQGRLRYRHSDGISEELTGNNNVGSNLGYGGGEFTSSKDFIVFTAKDGRLYRREWVSGKIKSITPSWGSVASPAISPNQCWVMYVCSDGKTDLLGVVNAQGYSWPMQFVRGADFYMQPAWHPSGKFITWVEWDHPNLPWQASRVKLGEVGGMQVRLYSEQWIAGDQTQSASQPQFSPDGKWLSYIINKGDWDSLEVLKLRNRQKTTLVEGEKRLLTTPAWVQGLRSYGWSSDSKKIFFIQNYGGYASLWQVRVKDRKDKPIHIKPYTWLSQLSVSPENDSLAFLASSPNIPKQVVKWQDRTLDTITSNLNFDFSIEYLPQPQTMEWHALDGSEVHGWYYPPTNPQNKAIGIPPLLVQVHGGPTAQQTLSFDLEKAYFTSRGYSVMAVDYRGSSGYGRNYQDKLHGRWGIVDAEDVIGAVKTLLDMGLADKNHLAIMGSSAGGFTVLNTLIHYAGLFRAAICSYPVTDLIANDQQTHKLEKFYNLYLVGDPQKDIEIYKDRSPFYHVDQIRDPLALFHGKNDQVVDPQQSEQIAMNLQQRGIPYIFKVYEGEGHGFRQAETLVDYYQKIELFFQKYLLGKS